MRTPVFEIIDDFGSNKRTTIAKAVTEQERAFNKTEFSNVLLAVETRTRRLCVLKASKRTDDESDTVDNQRTLENEARILQQLNRPGHRHLVQLLPVSAREYIAKDKETGVYFVAEPYYAGYTLADLINPLSAWEEMGLLALRWLNYRLLTLSVFMGRRPSSRKLIPALLPINEQSLLPSNKIDNFGKPIPVTDAIEIATCIADLLTYLHKNGYVHCDLKPSNVLYRKIQWPGWRDHRQLVVVDYGATVKLGEMATAGTPRWSPVEQRSQPAEASMDLYALGRILGYLLTGQIPALAESGQGVDEFHPSGNTSRVATSPKLTARNLRFPWYVSRQERTRSTQEINALLDSLLAVDPGKRLKSAHDLHSHLRGIRSMITKRQSITYMILGVTLALLLALTTSSGLRKDIANLVRSPFLDSAVDAQAAVHVEEMSLLPGLSDPTPATKGAAHQSTPTSTAMASTQPLALDIPGTKVSPTDVPWPTPTATATPAVTPTPTATPVILNTPVRKPVLSRVGVSIVETGDSNLQRCLQGDALDTFGSVQVKLRFKLDPDQIQPPFFEIQVQGGDLTYPWTVVSRQSVGKLFRIIDPGVYQFDGQIACDLVNCRTDKTYEWRIRLTDEYERERGASDWCHFKFQ